MRIRWRQGKQQQQWMATCIIIHLMIFHMSYALQSLRAAHEDSMAAREAAAAVDRQYKHLRRQYDLDKARLDTEVS